MKISLLSLWVDIEVFLGTTRSLLGHRSGLHLDEPIEAQGQGIKVLTRTSLRGGNISNEYTVSNLVRTYLLLLSYQTKYVPSIFYTKLEGNNY